MMTQIFLLLKIREEIKMNFNSAFKDLCPLNRIRLLGGFQILKLMCRPLIMIKSYKKKKYIADKNKYQFGKQSINKKPMPANILKR